MFSIDEVTLVCGIVMLVLCILIPFLNPLMVRLKPDEKFNDIENDNPSINAICGDEESSDAAALSAGIVNDSVHQLRNASNLPGVSVVITVEDEGENLKSNLSKWLSQSYNGNYQVIVVVSGNDSLVDNILKQYRDDNRLYTTFIPSSSRYMSRKKLAVTVGVKAAKYEWVLLSEVDCYPSSETVVASFAAKCTDNTDIVLGYTCFEDDFQAARRFDTVHTIYRQLAKAQRGKAWGFAGNGLMLRKKMFIEGKGFDGNLKYARGEYDFLASKYSSDCNTAVFCNLEEMIMRQPLSNKGWRNKVLNYIAIRKTLNGATKARLFFNASMCAMAISNISVLSVAAYSLYTSRFALLIAALAAFVISVILRMVVLSCSIRPYLDDMPYFKMWWFEQTLPFRNALRLFRYHRADKYDFISHKV